MKGVRTQAPKSTCVQRASRKIDTTPPNSFCPFVKTNSNFRAYILGPSHLSVAIRHSNLVLYIDGILIGVQGQVSRLDLL